MTASLVGEMQDYKTRVNVDAKFHSISTSTIHRFYATIHGRADRFLRTFIHPQSAVVFYFLLAQKI